MESPRFYLMPDDSFLKVRAPTGGAVNNLRLRANVKAGQIHVKKVKSESQSALSRVNQVKH